MSPAGDPTPQFAQPPGRGLLAVHVVALALAALVIQVTHRLDHWDLPLLAAISVFAAVSDLTYVDVGASKLRVSGSFLGIMLAVILLGGGPAAAVGALTILVGWLRSREAPHFLRNNVVTFVWAPLTAGLFFHGLVHAGDVASTSPIYYVLVFAAFVVALAVNFAMVAGYQCFVNGSSLKDKARDALVPLLSAELLSALLTMAGTYLAVTFGPSALGPYALMLGVFQYLVGELLTSKHRSEELRRVAVSDELTGLPNRARLRAAIDERIAAAEGGGGQFVVMLMDLDRFKEINDTLGHRHGDMLLREFGVRLAEFINGTGLVARLGGDEFAVLRAVPQSDAPGWPEAFAEGLLAHVQQPFSAEDFSIDVEASIGIVRFPADGQDVETLLRRADMAMYAAKGEHRGYRLYGPEQDKQARRHLYVISNFRRALEAGEIEVHYQPIIELDQLRVRAAEGLVRWNHPQRGLLSPGVFMPAVEQSHLIGLLTEHVLDSAIGQCAAWRQDGHDLSIAVNLSVRNLVDNQLPRVVEQLLSKHGLPPGALELEITESMIMADPERALAVLSKLSDLGARISIDDFGTGYSSLENLRRMPIDELKIDRSFVTPMLNDESDLIIVRSTINLGHDLGLRVIAEGVEDAPTMERLAGLGCDLVQGFHVSRPLAPETFSRWIGGPLEQFREGHVADLRAA